MADPASTVSCEPFAHESAVSKVKKAMPDETLLASVAELFKVFGDPTRSRIICALQAAELCVCDIANLLDMSSSAISHQLRILKQSRVVNSRREGKTVYYSLADEHIKSLFDTALMHMSE